MSGFRCLGSSCGSGLKTISDLDPVMLIIFSKLAYRELDRIAKIHWTSKVITVLYEQYQTFHQVVDVSRTTAFAIRHRRP